MNTENENRTGVDNSCHETENTVVSQVKNEDSSFSVGDAIIFIVVMILVGFALWEGGNYVANVAVPKYIMPVVSDAVVHTKRISPDIEFRSYQYRNDGYVARTGSDTKLLDRVDWVQVGESRDSLAVFSRKGKRGYINRFTGEVVIPATYSRAWVFSEGLAAVVHDNRLKFIDHSGKVVIDRNLFVRNKLDDFVFHHGHCMVYDAGTSKAGLMGADGQWRLDANWECLYDYGQVWVCGRNGMFGLYHIKKGMVLDPVYRSIRIEDTEIYVHGKDNMVSRYDLEGNILTELVIESIEPLVYSTQQVDLTINRDDVCCVMAVADCKLYRVDTDNDGMYCGLMDKYGNCITKPVFRQIDAITHNRFLVWPQGMILDSTGKEVDCYNL